MTTSTSTPAAALTEVPSQNRAAVRILGDLSFVLGFASIALSIVVWLRPTSPDPALGERFAIFIGLWAPTFFILSGRLSRYGKARLAEATRSVEPIGDARKYWGP